jgi:MoCo/4Fe-4S cofactor protein with predicted Tat translocation signal
MSMSKKYWKGLPELHNSPEFQEQANNEFAQPLPMDEFLSSDEVEKEGTSRRDFLKVMGFSTAAVALAACETPVIKSIPYVVKPEEITPGVANYYASTFYDGHDYSSVLVKTREGRPIKIEGNDLSKITHGGTTARVQASVLGLYDGARLRGPILKKQEASWKSVDDDVAKSLSGGTIRILTSTIISPSTKAVIAEFISKYPNTKHITYDAVSYNALSKANQNVWGKSVVSFYDFSKAKTIVGLACDFLGNWLNPAEFAKQYALTRKVSKEKPEMSKHYHFESNLSLTGANADERYMVKATELGAVAVALFNEVASATGNAKVNGSEKISNPEALKAIKIAAETLLKNKGQSIVVSGINDEGVQTLVNGINKMLDNYGKTVDVENHFNLKQGNDKEFAELVAEMAAGKIDVLLTYATNPIYTAPASLKFAEAYNKVPTKISFASVLDETAQLADIVCPDHHWLESWNDANPKRGHYSLQQPTINPIFSAPRHEGTRQFQDSILKWSGAKTDYLTYLQGVWNNHIFPNQGKYADFHTFWAHTLHDGVVKTYIHKDVVVAPIAKDSTGRPVLAGVATIINELVGDSILKPEVETKDKNKKESVAVVESLPTPNYNEAASQATTIKGGAFDLVVYEKIGLGNGNSSNNPWLMELPDPISKVTWDNYITMSPIDVKALGLNEMLRQDIVGSIVDVTANGVKITVPVFPQPGQAPGTIGLALGYGRSAEAMKVANGIGVNAFPLLNVVNHTFQTVIGNVTVTKAEGTHKFAATQIQHTIMGREEYLLREVSLPEFKALDKNVWNPVAELPVHGGGKKHVNDIDLWDAHPRLNHKWGLTIDMNTCIGCSACVVACTSENNVSVVGKEEVAKTRDMFWLRIDRYYSSNMNKAKAHEEHVGAKQMYIEMENPSENPKVTFQPMMCQHCNHAPCETVCPVLATSHSTEGLNMMTYNRCIGTRYCANNCPFKVRRFNWFNYTTNDWFASVNPAQQELGRMVLNPDVVVRSRGVMEKCSMCQQRLQAGKLVAKKKGVPLEDGLIKTACQQACPTNAIMFGDVNDEKSEVTKWREDDRNYLLLEEVGVKPTVSYMIKVRNQEEAILEKEEVVAKHENKKEEGHKEENH